MNNLTTIISFVYPHEPGIPRSLLESEGIECFLRDEMIVSVDPFYSNAIGGIKLQVWESDAERATEILIGGGFIKEKAGKIRSGEEEAGIKLSDGSTCPYCGSAEIVRNKKFSGKSSIFASALTLLMLGCPVPFFRKIRYCMDCGKDFKKKKHKSYNNNHINN